MTPQELAKLFQGNSREPEQRPLQEAQAATLLEEFARYSQPCPFKPGDLITPRATSTYKFEGEPHLVLEVFERPIVVQQFGDDLDNITSHMFGQRLDIRVAVMDAKGIVLTFMNESWRHEKYTGPMPHIAG